MIYTIVAFFCLNLYIYYIIFSLKHRQQVGGRWGGYIYIFLKVSSIYYAYLVFCIYIHICRMYTFYFLYNTVFLVFNAPWKLKPISTVCLVYLYIYIYILYLIHQCVGEHDDGHNDLNGCHCRWAIPIGINDACNNICIHI